MIVDSYTGTKFCTITDFSVGITFHARMYTLKIMNINIPPRFVQLQGSIKRFV